MPLEVIELGVTEYSEALKLQQQLVEERSLGKRPDTLILLEHPHVFTRGRSASDRTLREAVHPVYDIERGGDITYHGPGQLVGYPILHLKERNLLVGRYLRALEDVLIAAVGTFGIEAVRIKGFTGIWAEGRKLASIGIAVKSWVSHHGFALNVTTDLSQFRHIYPCGLEPERMTSIEKLLGRAPEMAEVRGALTAAFCRIFQCRERVLRWNR